MNSVFGGPFSLVGLLLGLIVSYVIYTTVLYSMSLSNNVRWLVMGITVVICGYLGNYVGMLYGIY